MFQTPRRLLEAMAFHPRVLRWFLSNRLRRLAGPLWGNHLDGQAPPPRTVTLKPTFLCNARCKMCSYANLANGDGDPPLTHDKEALPLELAKAMADELAPHHVCVSISGGEPFLYSPLFELLDYLRSKDIMSVVTTNGTLIQRRLQELVAAPPDILVVSILGPPETHDRIIGLRGKQEQIVESIRMVNDARKRRGSRYPLVVLNTPMLADNAHCLAEVVDLANDLEVFGSQFQHLWFRAEEGDQPAFLDQRPCGTESMRTLNGGPPVAGAETIWKEMERAKAKRSQGPVVFYPHLSREETITYYNSPMVLLKRKKAVCAWLFAQVQPNGDVVPCLGEVAGNLANASLLEIWNGPRMKKFRHLLQEKNTLPLCSRCCLYWRND